jgi:DNA invertase Pin-like site-specific DNA recombinase
MMGLEAHQKVRADHLKRDAYLYIRQSTLRQVIENTESTKRQYNLGDHAVALGWPIERLVVIDNDLGQSGASAVDREGFQELVAAVGMGKVGIVLGLEVSRLARNSTDWHRLLEICALTDTLILDEDGVYDPAHYNDRLLLGLKGTLSEAELHVIRARLQGGILNKARRAELKTPLPIGFVYNQAEQTILDPDRQVQDSLQLFFETFNRAGSALATVKMFRQRGLLFPRRLSRWPQKGDLVWTKLTHPRALQLLHNPRYAGAFAFGKRRVRKRADGSNSHSTRDRDQWILVQNAHPGYISWEQFQENERRLRENAQAHGDDRRNSPPREGPALLQGLALCGACGRRMTVRYHTRGTRLVPDYVCQAEGIKSGTPICHSIRGELIDHSIGKLLIQEMTPMALEITLAVQKEFETRLEEVDRLRHKQVERARYEADQAKHRYMHVDPANRLVADTLEAEWNSKLRTLNQTQEEYERLRQTDQLAANNAQRVHIATLTSDFPRLWRDPKTPDREKKRMVRLLLEDVTLLKNEQIQLHVRFKGGVAKSLTLPLPMNGPYQRTTPPATVEKVDGLLDTHTETEIAVILNEEGLRSGMGQAFTPLIVHKIRRAYGLRDRFQRMRALGLLTIREIAAKFGVATCSVRDWRNKGLLRSHRYNDRGECLYEPPADDLPGKNEQKRPYLLEHSTITESAKGVQYEA